MALIGVLFECSNEWRISLHITVTYNKLALNFNGIIHTCRGYYTVARRYEFYVRVARTIYLTSERSVGMR